MLSYFLVQLYLAVHDRLMLCLPAVESHPFRFHKGVGGKALTQHILKV